MKVFVDTNVMLDYISKRSARYDDARAIMESFRSGRNKGYIAAHSVTDVFYVLRKEYSDEERRTLLALYLDLVDVVRTDRDKIISALERKDFHDFEDCLQDECAFACDADYIVTRNVKDFEQSKVKAITPADFIETTGLKRS